MQRETLVAKLKELQAKAKALLEASDDGVLSDEAQVEFDQHMDGIGDAEAALTNLNRLEASQAKLSAIPAPTSPINPMSDITQPVDEPARPVITGPKVKLDYFRSSDIQGKDPQLAAYTTGQWMKGQLFGDAQAMEWWKENGTMRPQEILTGYTDTAAAYLVNPEFEAALIDNRDRFGMVRQYGRVVPMGSDLKTIPRIATSMSASWTGEGATISASDPAFDRINLSTKKLSCLTRLTNEIANDSAIDLAEWLAGDFSRAFAEAEDDAAVNGTGTSSYGGVYGIVGQMDANEGYAGVHTAASGNDAFEDYTVTDLSTVLGLLPEYAYARDPAWYCSQVCYGTCFQRLGMAGGGTNTMTLREDLRTLAGFPVRINSKWNTSTGDQSEATALAFGDLGSVVTLGDRQQTSIQILRELYAATDEIAVKGIERVALSVHSLGDSSTAGPIIGLMGD